MSDRIGAVEAARLDQWLWAVRICKTRSVATDVCRGGHVAVNGTAAKAATPVRVGDRIVGTIAGRRRVVEVVKVLTKRVGAPQAADCLIDQSPPPPRREDVVFVRVPGSGRPTKKDRRALDRVRR